MVRVFLWHQLNSALKPTLVISEANLFEPQFHHLCERGRKLFPDTFTSVNFSVSQGKKGVSSTVRPWMGEGLLRCPLRSPSHLFSFSRDFRRASSKAVCSESRQWALPYLTCSARLVPLPTQPPWFSPQSPSRQWRQLGLKGGGVEEAASPTHQLESFIWQGRRHIWFGFSIQFNNDLLWACQLQRFWARLGRERCKDKSNIICALKGIF